MDSCAEFDIVAVGERDLFGVHFYSPCAEKATAINAKSLDLRHLSSGTVVLILRGMCVKDTLGHSSLRMETPVLFRNSQLREIEP